MAGYLGNTQKISGRYTVDEFTSSGGTTYTLTKTPGAKNNIQVSAGGLVQYPSAYSVSGTTLTLTGVPSGQKVVVRHMGDTIPYPALDDNAVTSAKIAAGAVGTTDIANDAVTGAKLNPALVAGDVIYADGTDTINRLAKGTAAQVLTMNAGATAPEWAAGGGKILKVTSHIHQAQVTVSTTTMTTVTSKAITLVESNSKLLIIWTMWVGVGSDTAASLRILRDTTDLTSTFGGNTGTGAIPNTMGPVSAWAGHAGATYQPQNLSGTILDTPGGNVTYNFQIARTAGSNSTYLNTGSFSTNNGYHSKPASHAMFIEIAV